MIIDMRFLLAMLHSLDFLLILLLLGIFDPTEFTSGIRQLRDGSHRFHGVNSFSFFLAIFLQGSNKENERRNQ